MKWLPSNARSCTRLANTSLLGCNNTFKSTLVYKGLAISTLQPACREKKRQHMHQKICFTSVHSCACFIYNSSLRCVCSFSGVPKNTSELVLARLESGLGYSQKRPRRHTLDLCHAHTAHLCTSASALSRPQQQALSCRPAVQQSLLTTWSSESRWVCAEDLPSAFGEGICVRGLCVQTQQAIL